MHGILARGHLLLHDDHLHLLLAARREALLEELTAPCSWPTALLQLTRLTLLSLGWRHSGTAMAFGAPPEALGQKLCSLKTLSLLNCGVVALPASLSQLARLTALEVQCRLVAPGAQPPGLSLPSLPAAALRELSISTAAMPPAALQQSASLTMLKWDQCSAGAPQLQQISTLRQLRVLQFTFYGGANHAEALDDVQLPATLTRLELVQCQLQRLPRLPDDCFRRLRHLDVKDNRCMRRLAPSVNFINIRLSALRPVCHFPPSVCFEVVS